VSPESSNLEGKKVEIPQLEKIYADFPEINSDREVIDYWNSMTDIVISQWKTVCSVTRTP